MVHALDESWRVLKPGGSLVDIRPYLGNMRLELMVEGQARLVGLVDDHALVPDHQAVERTLEQGIKKRAFAKEVERHFDYEYLWDEPENLKEYVEENWTSRKLSRSLYRRLEQMAGQAQGETQVRIRDERVIARYRKLERGAG